MRLNASTDYALRVLLYLGHRTEDYVPASEIADVFDLSANHVAKLTKDLTQRGWLTARRGSGGGVRLAVDPARLRLGRVVTALEAIELVECFQPGNDACRLRTGCRLKGALREATRAFTAALDEYTLADLLGGRRLPRLLGLA